MAIPVMPAIAWAALTSDYRVKRLTSFLNPWEHPFDDGFQLTQALIAIGRGEWFGVGLGASVQKLFYLPEAHTDFILAVIAEELGLAGILLVLFLFAALVGRALMLGLRAVEQGQRFAGYCAFGVGLWLGLQTLVSIGVNLGVLPTKGLTLPLISSGGSSVLMTCAAIGLLLRVSYEVTRPRPTESQLVNPESLLRDARGKSGSAAHSARGRSEPTLRGARA
jgi:cell division protein FtsW